MTVARFYSEGFLEISGYSFRKLISSFAMSFNTVQDDGILLISTYKSTDKSLKCKSSETVNFLVSNKYLCILLANLEGGLYPASPCSHLLILVLLNKIMFYCKFIIMQTHIENLEESISGSSKFIIINYRKIFKKVLKSLSSISKIIYL